MYTFAQKWESVACCRWDSRGPVVARYTVWRDVEGCVRIVGTSKGTRLPNALLQKGCVRNPKPNRVPRC